MVTEEITAEEIKLARQGALSAYRSGRGVVESQDLVGEANLWLVSHMPKVVQWRDQGRHGRNKLRNACRQRCLTIIAKERQRRSGLEPGDAFYYSAQIIRELLPDIFDVDDWNNTSMAMSSEVRSPSRPSEGNNRLAMIADIRSAFYSLSQKDQDFLMDLYKDGGLPVDVVATTWEVTERTVKRRDDRIMEKMVERLGGEPPWAN
jgi:DNA-directed RNA polymerase specialized sigma24 family protein